MTHQISYMSPYAIPVIIQPVQRQIIVSSKASQHIDLNMMS